MQTLLNELAKVQRLAEAADGSPTDWDPEPDPAPGQNLPLH